MRIAYGYNRTERDFRDLNVKTVWLDTDTTEREERSAMLQGGLRKGDTLVILARGDLGVGGEVRIIEAKVADIGASIEVHDPPARHAQKPGRKPTFTPTPAQDKVLRALWHEPAIYTRAYVLRRASEVVGHPVSVQMLRYRYGPRTKPHDTEETPE